MQTLTNLFESTLERFFGWKRKGYRKTVSVYRRAIRDMVNRDQILQHAAETIHYQLKANTVLVWLYQQETGNLFLAYAIGNIKEPTIAEIFPLDIRIELLDGTQYVDNLPEGTSRQGLLSLGLQVSIPIILRNHLIGFVGIGYESYRGPYSEETVYWLDLLASESALALRNTTLEDQLHQLRPVYKSTIDARDDERKRLAAELHDDVMAQMTTLTMTISMARNQLHRLNGQIDPKIMGWLETVEQGMPHINQRLREIMNGLYPSVLTNLGLIAALRTHIDTLARQPLPPDGPSQTTITLTWEGFGERIIDQNLERDLYYVTRQAIDNAVKHAQAEQILVHLRWATIREQTTISITIRDTGRGMKALPEQLVGRDGRLGLVSMTERVTAWEGQLVMESEDGQGTTIRARIPLTQPPDTSDMLQQAVRRMVKPE